MKNFTIRQFAESCGAKYFGPEEVFHQRINGVVIDSRLVKEGDLFLAVEGQKVDGHQFIPDVYQKGAICAVSQKKLLNPSGPYLLVKDTLQALKDGAEAYRKTLDIPVIGITGSVGKTSTKEMVSSVLSQKFQVLKTPGNFNNEIGLPLTIFMIDPCHEAAVLEMGINHFGEMRRLSKIARPTHCIFTNIGLSHLEFLESRDGILKAKMEMLDYASKDAKVIINGDDDKLILLKDRTISFGLQKTNQIYADEIKNLGQDGICCTIHTGKQKINVTIPLLGVHTIYNALAGTCVGLSLGLHPNEIKRGIESIAALAGRGNVLHTSRYTVFDDCYNANPVSMCAMLDVLESSDARKVAILGDMGELGEDSASLHASVGEHLKNLHIDVLITIGTLSKNIHQAALSASPQTKCLHYANKNHFFEEMDSILQDGDAILVKASHAGGFEEIVHTLSKK